VRGLINTVAKRKIKNLLKSFFVPVGVAFICPPPTLAVTGGVGTNLWAELVAIVGRVIGFLLEMAAVVALGFVVYGGIMYIASGGDEKALSNAKGTVTSALLGFVLILGAILIINTLCNVMGADCFPEGIPALF
jgi:hypothetical protein